MKEKIAYPIGGFLLLFLLLIFLTCVGIFIAIDAQDKFMMIKYLFENPIFYIIAIPILIGILLVPLGFVIINPNNGAVLTFFGSYLGTAKNNGLFWINPFVSVKYVSLRARNFDSEIIKVNDKLGNPIMIGVILVWRVKDTYKALFEVDNYENFITIQSESAVRNLAGTYPYDNFGENEAEITLRSGFKEVSQSLEDELGERLEIAGIEIIEARISHLAYSPEIANAMLRRQQATAVVAARHKIVEGAVSMVEMALSELSKKQIVNLDEDKKAAMVSNLMVVLCSDKDASPVVNTGTLHQ
ncbi:MAG: SPFH domain-containing protein [Cytophagia bacterium]|nr:MAG: SPFH domain-containing protein [Cytophagales bacterium]TAF99315.1 MAG: SPFH domain-containing protein [Cytophagia bacterium]TAH29675.1 MAG: SPFH domain-containing protein [Cytophagales bacterium]